MRILDSTNLKNNQMNWRPTRRKNAAAKLRLTNSDLELTSPLQFLEIIPLL